MSCDICKHKGSVPQWLGHCCLLDLCSNKFPFQLCRPQGTRRRPSLRQMRSDKKQALILLRPQGKAAIMAKLSFFKYIYFIYFQSSYKLKKHIIHRSHIQVRSPFQFRCIIKYVLNQLPKKYPNGHCARVRRK